MTYVHGEQRAAEQLTDPRQREHRIKQKAAELARLEAALDRRIAAVSAKLPTETLPPPQWGGRTGLILATKEAEGHDPKRATRRYVPRKRQRKVA